MTVAQDHIFCIHIPNSAFRHGVIFMSFFIVTEQRKFYVKIFFKYIAGSPGGQLTAKQEISAVGL